MCIVLRATFRTYGAQEGSEGVSTRPGKSCNGIRWLNNFPQPCVFEEIRRKSLVRRIFRGPRGNKKAKLLNSILHRNKNFV